MILGMYVLLLEGRPQEEYYTTGTEELYKVPKTRTSTARVSRQ